MDSFQSKVSVSSLGTAVLEASKSTLTGSDYPCGLLSYTPAGQRDQKSLNDLPIIGKTIQDSCKLHALGRTNISFSEVCEYVVSYSSPNHW